jgi:hypothetical protein
MARSITADGEIADSAHSRLGSCASGKIEADAPLALAVAGNVEALKR